MIKKLIAYIIYYSGINFLASFLLRHKIYVLNFHSVCSSDNKDDSLIELYPDLTIDKDKFEKRIEYLIKRGHNFIKFSDLSLLSKSKNKILKPTILYFDDGFKDNLTNVLPILIKYKIPAVFFISTGLINRSIILWTLKHRYYLKQQGLNQADIKNEIKRLKIMSAHDRAKELQQTYQQNNFSFNPADFDIFLSWEDVLKLSKHAVEIGSHGVTHTDLRELDDDKIKYELEESRNIIKNKTNIDVKSFSLPHGRYNDKILEILKNNNYDYIVSKGLGLNNSEHLNFLNNVSIRTNDSMVMFKINLYVRNLFHY